MGLTIRIMRFSPASGMIFDADCLKEIASYLSTLMLERKIEKQNSHQ